MRRRALLAACCVVAGCGGDGSGDTSAPRGTAPPLGGSTVAVVGTVGIDTTLVRDVAEKNQLAPRQALDLLVADALAAQAAEARKLDATADVREGRRATLARLVTDRLHADAIAKGPPTDAEVEGMSKRHWQDVDAPELARAVHVVVMKAKDPAKQARALQVAEALRSAVEGATTADDFIARAKQVPTEGLDVRPQHLPDFAADGRAVDGSTFDTEFVKDAFGLQPGETSAVVSTAFGLHVIRMFERIPPKQMPLEERRARFYDDIIATRAHTAYVALIKQLATRHPVRIDSAADALMNEAITAPGTTPEPDESGR